MAEHFFCGIDVAKDRLDVMMSPEGLCFSVRNDAPGWAELVVRLRPLKISAIGLEPSGGYERASFCSAGRQRAFSGRPTMKDVTDLPIEG